VAFDSSRAGSSIPTTHRSSRQHQSNPVRKTADWNKKREDSVTYTLQYNVLHSPDQERTRLEVSRGALCRAGREQSECGTRYLYVTRIGEEAGVERGSSYRRRALVIRVFRFERGDGRFGETEEQGGRVLWM
jgi:hypothetical protein